LYWFELEQVVAMEKLLSLFSLQVLPQRFGLVRPWGVAPGLVQTPSTLQMIEARRRLDGLCRSNASGIDCAKTAMDV
jgi:hypothetical protein